MRILIADDHAVVRHGLRQILTSAFKHSVFGEAANSQEALDRVWKEPWDIVILDLTMPGRSGLEVLKEIKQARPKLPVLILSMHPEDQFAVRLLKAGASGYMTKESAPEELVGAVNKAVAGGRYVSVRLAEKLASLIVHDTTAAPHECLSDREFLILRLIASGKTVSAIARDLSLSVKTVSTYCPTTRSSCSTPSSTSSWNAARSLWDPPPRKSRRMPHPAAGSRVLGSQSKKVRPFAPPT
jgi:DNA-binding NarL/FixJ family response regulator